MGEHVIPLLSVLKGITTILGLYFLSVAFRAYRRHRDRGLGVLTVAVGFLTAATLVEGFVYQILGWDLATAHVAEAVLSLVGFAILLWSLRA